MQCLLNEIPNFLIHHDFTAPPAGAEEYADCISQDGYGP